MGVFALGIEVVVSSQDSTTRTSPVEEAWVGESALIKSSFAKSLSPIKVGIHCSHSLVFTRVSLTNLQVHRETCRAIWRIVVVETISE